MRLGCALFIKIFLSFGFNIELSTASLD